MSATEITPERSDEDIAQALGRIAARGELPTKRERWAGAVGLFVLFLMVAVVSRNAPSFDAMYREMDLMVPWFTAVVLAGCHGIADYPGAFAGFMFIVMWLYFVVIAKTKWRLEIMNTILILFFLGWGIFVTIALFLPLIGTMDRIGKA